MSSVSATEAIQELILKPVFLFRITLLTAEVNILSSTVCISFMDVIILLFKMLWSYVTKHRWCISIDMLTWLLQLGVSTEMLACSWMLLISKVLTVAYAFRCCFICGNFDVDIFKWLCWSVYCSDLWKCFWVWRNSSSKFIYEAVVLLR